MDNKSKNGIGHNSKTNRIKFYGQPPITKAVLELVQIAKESCSKAIKYLEHHKQDSAEAFTGKAALSEDLKRANYINEQYNENILKESGVFKNQPLRRIAKPKKLDAEQKQEKFHQSKQNYEKCWLELNDVESSLKQALDQEAVVGMVDDSEQKELKQ